jgi:hypothetical protein
MLDEKNKTQNIKNTANSKSAFTFFLDEGPLGKRQCSQTLFIKLIQLQFGISGTKVMSTDLHHPFLIFMQEKLIQFKPLNVIVLGQTQTDKINRMKIITNSSRT